MFLNLYINVMIWNQNTIAISKKDILSLINIVKEVSSIINDNNINETTKYVRICGNLEDYSTVVDDCDIIKRDLIDIYSADYVNIKIIEDDEHRFS